MGECLNQKDTYWQFIRGLCIAAVVLIHCPSGMGFSNAAFHSWFTLRQMINFPVATFVFMAGFFVSRQKVEARACSYVINRGGRLLIPYVLWSLLYLGASLAVSMLQYEAIGWTGYLIRLLTGGASAQLYYVLVLFQLVFLTPLLLRLLEKKVWRIVLYSISPIHLAVIYVVNIQISSNFGSFGELSSAWLFFYLLGLDARAGRLDGFVGMVRLWHVLIALFISVVEAYLLLNLTTGEPVFNQIRYCNFFFVAVFDMWLLKINQRLDRRALEGRWWYQLGVKLGNASYGIYFCHMAVLLIVTKVLQFVGLDYLWGVYWILSWVLSLSVSWLLVRLACVMLAKLHMHWGIMALGLE